MHQWLHKKCLQNFIIRKPGAGAPVMAIFCFVFLILYRPLDTHPGHFLGYEATMAAYCLITGLSVFGLATWLKHFSYFSDQKQWTILREILSILFVLTGMGFAIFLTAFLIEPPAYRWNFQTLADSIKNAYLIGIIPFAFFTLVNTRFWLPSEYVMVKKEAMGVHPDALKEETITIRSQLKKETLKFHPDQLIYAESEGNYVVFYLEDNKQILKKMIRNSMNNIEQDLEQTPHIIRIHRAFMVNLKKVRIKRGNTLGYRLKLSGIETEIPVSRNHTRHFNQLTEQMS